MSGAYLFIALAPFVIPLMVFATMLALVGCIRWRTLVVLFSLCAIHWAAMSWLEAVLKVANEAL